MSEKLAASKEKSHSFLWPLDRIAKVIGDIIFSPFRPPKS